MPVERMIVPPFLLLREFVAHEQELLAGVTEHEAVVDTQVCEALPSVARHPTKERSLAVHHLVMGQRQYEILGESVNEPERDLVMMIFAVNRILADERERVIHPAHVPLVAEAEPAMFDRPAHHRPGGRF